MAKVTATAETFRELFVYADGVLYNRVGRGRAKAGASVGTKDAYGYLVVKVQGRVHKVHRVIYAMFNGMAPAIIDHANGNVEDNRIENLRPASAAANGFNRKTNKTSGTKIKGVAKLRGKWMAQCQAHGRRHYLGLFATPSEAANAVAAFRTTTHKEFANHG